MELVWNGTSVAQVRNEGYKVSEDEIYNRLILMGVEIDRGCIMPSDLRPIAEVGIGIQYQSECHDDVGCDLLINNRLPLDYAMCSGYNVGFSYWETTRLPEDWVRRMNMMDEVWTTSSWAKGVFISSGVKVPTYNFDLGVDSRYFFPVKRTLNNQPFTFLSIGSPSTRKNSQLAVDAFIKLFGKDDRFKLLYKSVDSPDARLWSDRGEPSSIKNHPNIEVIEGDVSIEELALIYDRADCLIYPTSGEGWGMLPFQAIAKGIPTICTDATACTEYASMSVPLDFKWGTNKMSGIYGDCGEWAEPNFDDLCDKMLYVIYNYDDVSNFTYNNAVTNQDKWSWDTVAKGYYDRLCQILNQ